MAAYADEDLEKEKHSSILWDCKLVQVLWKPIWRCLSKLEIVRPEDSPILPGHQFKRYSTLPQGHMLRYVLYYSQKLDMTQMSLKEEQIQKM